MLIFPVLFVGVVLFSGAAFGKFPDDVPRCKAGDRECIGKTMESVARRIGSGHAGLNLPPIDPLHLDQINIIQGDTNSSPFRVQLDLLNQDIVGLSQGLVDSVRGFNADPSGVFAVNCTVPKVSWLGDYKINGQILLLPIKGHGRSNITLVNQKIYIKFTLKDMQQKNKTYVKLDKFKVTMGADRLYMNFENLFNGDKALSDNMNLFLNENWQEIFRELNPSMDDIVSKILFDLLTRVFAKVPYSEFYVEQ